MAEKGELLYIESLKDFKKRNFGYIIIFLFILFVFFMFILRSILLYLEGNQITIYFAIPLFIFIFILFLLYLINRKRLIIYEHCFQPQMLPMKNLKLKTDLLIHFVDIKSAIVKKQKDIDILEIFTKNNKNYQLWDLEKKALNILINQLNKNQIKVIDKS